MNRCFEEANRAFSYRYLIRRNQIIYSEEEKNGTIMDEKLKLSSLNVINMDRKVVERFLKTGLKSEVRHFIDEYFVSVGEGNVQSYLLRQYVTMDIFFATVSMLGQLGYESKDLVDRCGDFQTMTTVFSSVEQTKAYLRGVFEAAIDLREAVSQRKYSSLLKDARVYIEQNFDNEEISLNTVAASVNLSPNHFSTIFNQETGQTFIEFLTHVRMEKAKELLRGPLCVCRRSRMLWDIKMRIISVTCLRKRRTVRRGDSVLKYKIMVPGKDFRMKTGSTLKKGCIC